MRPREDWNEEVEAHVAASIIVGLVSGALKFGMYLSFPLNIAMVIVGIVHRNDCPVNTRIGWYLVFGGAAGIISVVLKVIMVMAWSCMRKQSEKGLKYDPVAHPALAMVSLLLISIIVMMDIILTGEGSELLISTICHCLESDGHFPHLLSRSRLY